MRGMIWATLVGYLFLPEAYTIDLPALPAYNKVTAISVGLLLGLFVTRDRIADENGPVVAGDRLLQILLILCTIGLVASPFLTFVTNGEALVNGGHVRPPLTGRDATSMLIENIILFVPFFLAWRYFSHPDYIRELLVAVIIMAFFYSFLMLFESRMSPQLHRWVYGYFQASWVQHIRGGEFRPIVFLRHGLWLGFFMMAAVLAAFALSRESKKRIAAKDAAQLGRDTPVSDTESDVSDGQAYFSEWEVTKKLIPLELSRFRRALHQNPNLPQGMSKGGITWFSQDDLQPLREHFASEGAEIPDARQESWQERRKFLFAGLWILLVLLASRNLGASVLAIGFAALIFFAPRRIQFTAIIIASFAFLTYPMLKHYGLSPTDHVMVLAEKVSPDRAQSFGYRLRHEGQLIERALEKPLFGWGGYARAQIYDDLGRHKTTSDGLWIITLGERGWLGYLSFFCILVLPVVFLVRTARRKEIPTTIIAIGMISAANFVYLIPNSTLSPVGLIMFGALAAFAQRDVASYDPTIPDLAAESVKTKTPYTRFSGGPTRDHAITRGQTARAIDPSVSQYRRRTPQTDA